MDTFTEVGHHGRGPKPELLCVAPETRPKPREDRKYRGMAMVCLCVYVCVCVCVCWGK